MFKKTRLSQNTVIDVSKVKLMLELSAKKIDDHTYEYSNRIRASATGEFQTLARRTTAHLNKPGLPDSRHRTLITAKLRTLPKTSNADLYREISHLQ